MKNEIAMVMSELEVQSIVKETVRQMFLNLGVNTSDPEDLVNFQQDMHFTRKERKRKELMEVRIVTHVTLMFVTAAASAFITYLLNGGF